MELKKRRSPILAASTSKTQPATAIDSLISRAARQAAAHHHSTENKIVKVVSILLSSSHVLSILTALLNDRSNGIFFFGTELAGMLRRLGKDLAVEGGEMPLASAADLLENEQGSHDATVEMLRRVRRQQPEYSAGGLNSSFGQALDGSKLSTRVQSELRGRKVVSDTPVESDAQPTFECDLLHHAHKSYEARLCSIMTSATLVGQSGTDLSPSNSPAVTREISRVPLHLFSVIAHTSFSSSDAVK